MSGELSSAKDPVLMKMFLLKRNNRSKISDVVVSGELVNDDFIQMQFIILSAEHCNVFLPCRLGHSDITEL